MLINNHKIMLHLCISNKFESGVSKRTLHDKFRRDDGGRLLDLAFYPNLWVDIYPILSKLDKAYAMQVLSDYSCKIHDAYI